MRLITSFNPLSSRFDEYNFSLNKNIENRYISSITVFSESALLNTYSAASLLTKNIKNIIIDRRPTFKTLVDYANDNFCGELVCITNADIFFDESLCRLKQFPNNFAICLTRSFPPIDINNPDISSVSYWAHPDSNLSFDSFFFYPKINSNNFDFPIGIPGCDNRFAYELYNSSLLVINPAKIINSFHVHKNSSKYKDEDFLQGKYLRINLTNNLNYVKRNVSRGWSEGGVSHYPDDWVWLIKKTEQEINNSDAPDSIKEYYKGKICKIR
jgi:hypothetical protein